MIGTLNYIITFENEEGYIEVIDTECKNDNNIFSYKINNTTGYKLYSENDLIIEGEYIFYIPGLDITV